MTATRTSDIGMLDASSSPPAERIGVQLRAPEVRPKGAPTATVSCNVQLGGAPPKTTEPVQRAAFRMRHSEHENVVSVLLEREYIWESRHRDSPYWNTTGNSRP